MNVKFLKYYSHQNKVRKTHLSSHQGFFDKNFNIDRSWSIIKLNIKI